METFEVRPIGVLHCELMTRQETPRNYDISHHIGVVEVFPEFHEALDGIKEGQTVVVLFWLHQARRDILKVYPRGDRSRGLHGVFATRSPVRPNPIAISEFEVLDITENGLTVRGVDILDGTPVIDIKKKI